MLFPERPQNVEQIKDFCRRFNEGFRVEYKLTLNDRVRKELPKVLSSFANSLGGVLVIGVKTKRGIPVPPFGGFDQPPHEELPLTIQDICLQNIHPPIVPRSTVIESDVVGKVFLVVQVDESWEAPHAIENSKKVYVRTDAASNPYDLADVDLIIELIRRREEPARLLKKVTANARSHAFACISTANPYAEILISPPYPRRPLCSNDEAWTFLSERPYRGGTFFSRNSLKRIQNGAGAFGNREYGEISKYGLSFGAAKIETYTEVGCECSRFYNIFQLSVKMLSCAYKFYEAVGFQGDLVVQLSLHNMKGRAMPFIPVSLDFSDELETFRSFDVAITAEQITSSETLKSNLEEVLQQLLLEVCWSYWQGSGPFPTDTLKNYVHESLQRMGRL